MRSSVTVLSLLVSSCGATATGPAATPAVHKVTIEASPPDTDTATHDETSAADDAGRPEEQQKSAPVPHISTVKVIVNGALPQSVVEEVVREGFVRVRMCYERFLARDPSLQGTVNASFVIESDGSVSNPRDLGSSVPDPTLVKCVVSSFYGCSFPDPASGTVSVQYSFMLETNDR